MTLMINAVNVPQALSEALWHLRAGGSFIREESRNGSVLTVPSPTMLMILNPLERVLFNPVRDANPFFHVMEWVWMMAGSNDAHWLAQFNKRMLTYADDGILRGAYGWRWRHPTDQITDCIALLRRDPTTRQAVISMWDPEYDGSEKKTSDRPCNTHIYFRRVEDRLNMTVCNRSNDMIWGMLGANAVHMTFLHELVAHATHMSVGPYRVMTNNLHVYEDLDKLHALMSDARDYDAYQEDDITYLNLLGPGEDWEELREDCEDIVAGNLVELRTYWARNVALPIHEAYLRRNERDDWIKQIRAADWKRACQEWVARRDTDRTGGSAELSPPEVPHGASDTRGDSGGAHGGGDGNPPRPDGWEG